jgi:hypothetical protein
MDPWLEHPTLWSDVHRNLISADQELLTPQVAPDFYVRGEERVYIAGVANPIEPAVFVVTCQPQSMLATVGAAHHTSYSTTSPVIFQLVSWEEEVRERYLEICERGTHHIVTVIELLSPSNKVKGSPRYRQFAGKRTDVLNSDAHWLEIDLLRGGTRWELAPMSSDYCVMLSRVERRRAQPPTTEARHFNLRAHLPTIPVPLRPPHANVTLDLQHALALVYERAGYGYSIDYTQPAEPPLAPVDTAWAQSVLQQRG